jgi:hypothetical protein
MDAGFQDAVGFGDLWLRELFERECGLQVATRFIPGSQPAIVLIGSVPDPTPGARRRLGRVRNGILSRVQKR